MILGREGKRVIVGLLLLLALATDAAPQGADRSAPRHANAAVVLGGNMAIAGLTATVAAFLGRRTPAKAFAIGAIGGAAQYGGKWLVSKSTVAGGVAGNALAALGASVTANAGRGVPALDDLYLPYGPLRIRVTRATAVKVGLTLNAYDAIVFGAHFANTNLTIDWDSSWRSATFVFVTDDKYIVVNGDSVNGVATGSAVVVSSFADDPAVTLGHELVHVQQHRFLEETVGRAFEHHLRQRGKLRWIPQWLEIGVTAPAYYRLESSIFGHRASPLLKLAEAEAEWFEHK